MLKEEDAAMEAYFAEQEAERQRGIAEAEEASWPEDDEPNDFYDELDEQCPGGCCQTVRNCVCDELTSLRRYHDTPLEFRDGPWTS
jgi:hypothetical protein